MTVLRVTVDALKIASLGTPVGRTLRVSVLAVGAPGPGGGTEAVPTDAVKMRVRAGETLSGHRAVKSTSDGARYPDIGVRADVDLVFGITINAATAGDTVDIVRAGHLDHLGWSWTPGGAVYVGSNGVLTQTLPQPHARRVAMAVTATSIEVQLHPTLTLL